MGEPGNAPPPDAGRLHQPLARLLRPLVRFLIRCGVPHPALSDLLRELYVNVAEHEFALPDKDQTDSRISLLTGIHRKEVRRLRGAGAPVRSVPSSVSRTAQIVAHWLASDTYQDELGRPAPLLRSGKGVTFESLVEEVTRDVRPRAILDEWLDRGLVTIDANDMIALTDAAIAPGPGDERQLYYFGRNLHDHIAAATANVVSSERPFFERAVHYEGLSEDAARRLEALSRDLAMKTLVEANKAAASAVKTSPEGPWRWNLGIYVFREREPHEATSERDTERDRT
jgi:hypothetical protein